jgi:hypothetical protein
MAAISLAAACGLYFAAIEGVGFPDGHLTDYERWALPLRKAAVGALALLAVGFSILAAGKADSSGGGRLFRAFVVAVVVVVLGILAAVPAIGLHVLHLEHGQGG